jgi:2-polyprenyl-6-methoxyphenol hydroxylase-like FAD-dependent oxidoreductase
MYDTLVNTMRGQIPRDVATIHAKVVAIANSAERSRLVLSNGEEISARLVILANGLNLGLRHMLGIKRRVISHCHSVTLGFDVEPGGRASFEFPALTYWPGRAAARMAYLSIFPIGNRMRGNLMVYRDIDDPWLSAFKQAPEQTMCEMMPRLSRMMGEFRVSRPVKVRPADLYVNDNHSAAGVVLAGDAFSTSCPAAGTGTTKVFNDVQLLCNRYIPRWLASEGMSADKLAAYYNDPEKLACEAACLEKAYHLRSLSTETGLAWRAQRWARFAVRLSDGISRAIKKQVSTGQAPRRPPAIPTRAGRPEREHDPEKCEAVFPRDKRIAFARRSCSNKKAHSSSSSSSSSSS